MKMKKRTVVFLAICAIVLISSSAFAGVVPTWRGDDGSTHQLWLFDTPANPAVPEVVTNPYGNGPIATIQDGGDPLDMWWIQEDRGHIGVWKTEGNISLFIPNAPNTDPDSFKHIVIQMIYDSAPGADAWMKYSADGSDPVDGFTPVVSEDLGDGYRYSRWEITIRPNPLEETIFMLPFYCNLYVDSIEVDTICIPEPATLAILGLGSLLAIRRKRA